MKKRIMGFAAGSVLVSGLSIAGIVIRFVTRSGSTEIAPLIWSFAIGIFWGGFAIYFDWKSLETNDHLQQRTCEIISGISVILLLFVIVLIFGWQTNSLLAGLCGFGLANYIGLKIIRKELGV